MKKYILSFAFGFIAYTGFCQSENLTLNHLEIQHTYKVTEAKEIISPSNNTEIIKDNKLAFGVVKVVLLVDHNTTNEMYNKLLRQRISSVDENNKIGFVADSRQILGRNGFELQEEFKTIVFMSEKTAKKLR